MRSISTTKSSTVRDVLLVAAGALLCLLPALGSTSLWDPDEPRFAEATRQMIARGDYVTPFFNEAPRWEKPILLYWAQVVSVRIAGDNEWAARAPAAVAAAGCVVLIYLLGSTLFTRRAALLASGMWLATFRFVMYARQGLTDVPVLCCVLAAMLGFTRAALGANPRWAWFAWIAVGLGVLTKGPIGLLPCLVIAAWLLVMRDWRGFARLRWLRGGLVVFAIAAPWYLLEIVLHGRQFITFHLGYEVVARAVSTEFAGPARGPLFYLRILPGEIVPWTLLVGAAVVWAAVTWWRTATDERARLALLAVWSVGVLALFSAARYKLPHYTLPAYPPLLIAAGVFIDAAWSGSRRWSLALRSTLVATASVIVVIYAVLAGLLFLLFPADAVGTMLLVLLAIATSVAGLAIARHGPAPATLGVLLSAAALLYPVVAWRWSDEVSSHFQAAQALGRMTATIAPAGAPVASTLVHPSLVYYARRPVRFLQSPEEVAHFLAEPTRRYLVLSCRDVESTIDLAGAPLHVVARQPVFSPRLRHLLDGRMMTPANELCLVSSGAAATQPGDAAAVFAGSLPGELSESTRLGDRRSLVTGDRAYAMGDASGLYPACGWHIRGEMGGFWSPPIKLLDGIWFALDGRWLGEDIPTARYTGGYGYHRFSYQASSGLRVDRIDFAPDGLRATLVGLRMRTVGAARSVRLDLYAHSELMASYPWDQTTPRAAELNLVDEGRYDEGTLLFAETGTSKVPNTSRHDYAAVVGSSQRPAGHGFGSRHRGPQEPAVICPREGTAPYRCDDSADGRGTGGRLSYRLQLSPERDTIVWFAVAGSDKGAAAAKADYQKAISDPARLLLDKVARRAAIAGSTVVDLPGDRRLQRSVEWSKQNLADSVQEAHELRLRDVKTGKAYPPPKATLPRARWAGAGFPDYPWLFGTDGQYTAFALVTAGQFDTVKAHLRALRDVSEAVNDRSGKVVHEVTPTGDVFFGTNASAGNTDETVKFPSAVALAWRWTGDNRFRDEMYDFAVRNLQYVYRELDEDEDGWLEGLANVEREGMGVEKLDSTVYLVRGLRDLADLASSKGDATTVRWATMKAVDLERRFERQWWVAAAKGYADSIDNPDDPTNDNTPIFQRHWTGVTPMEVELIRPDRPAGPLANAANGVAALVQRERTCYTGELGLYHTGSGPTSAPNGSSGPSCDSVISSVGAGRSTFSLNTAVMAVAEGNFGRMGRDQQQRYTTGNARLHLDPKVWETPGAMAEIGPSPDSTANIDRPFTNRSMSLQAWGAYGVLWPVVHQQLGVSPDLGRGRLAVVPQVPDDQFDIAGRNIRIGDGAVEVEARRTDRELRTTVRLTGVRAELTIGALLPKGASVAAVTLNGQHVPHQVVRTARGAEVRAVTRAQSAELVVSTRRDRS